MWCLEVPAGTHQPQDPLSDIIDRELNGFPFVIDIVRKPLLKEASTFRSWHSKQRRVVYFDDLVRDALVIDKQPFWIGKRFAVFADLEESAAPDDQDRIPQLA